MAKDLNVTILLDVYGQLLTEKQRNAIDMYYNEDLSLSEIADVIDISRQGVRESIKQGEKHLTNYEEKLGIVERFHNISSKLEKLNALLENADFDGKDEFYGLIDEISKEISIICGKESQLMAFESLGDKLQGVFKKLRGKGKLNEKDIKDAMREIKLALLEADVNFKVVKEFVNIVSEKALGQEIMESLTPAQQLVKIVNEELTQMIGGEVSRLEFSQKPPTVIMMCGLQGAGKTTATGKLALNLTKKMNKRPLMVACDVYRPAAIKQLEVLGKQIQVPVFSMGADVNPVTIAKEAVAHAIKHGNDPVILDTAGRLHIDEQLMDELANIKAEVNPTEILLVVDAMTGQDAVNVAKSFNDQLDITGVILSKLDGDTRGGAALSVKQVTGKPIKYASVGEKLSDLEQFHPDRMASRILGMGDVLTLIDKAQETIDEKKAQELEEKIRKQQFDLDDYLEQFKQIRKMGSFSQILGMLPGIDKKMLESVDTEENEKKMLHIEAIIQSMTQEERRKPSIIGASRKVRISKGSGTRVQDVNQLLKQFEQMQKMMKQLSGGRQAKMLKRLRKRK